TGGHLDSLVGRAGRNGWIPSALPRAASARSSGRAPPARSRRLSDCVERVLNPAGATGDDVAPVGGRRHCLHVLPGDAPAGGADAALLQTRVEGSRRSGVATARPVRGGSPTPPSRPGRNRVVHGFDG